MFHFLGPQAVQSDEGFVVRVLDRERVEYAGQGVTARVSVEFGRPVAVYRNTIDVVRDERISDGDLSYDELLDRIRRGIEAMGSAVELV
jgi:hypothetical protein